ncbi:hypothetical protein HO662_06390 [Streptococcus suis]|uniref:hypothetical protein n=1 Tax=Streptococcus suis TaxID=1307 RepID=UPI0005CDC6A3|nr:hypothetical protein [Streptococcus suis]NQH31769.1 hypothetical protein [Streptococcus suis]NQN18082.1 hypothetical protein [Streptococcus suis]NQP47972.1 hypothetical protein [Streptococcus suis]NQP56064.1 hypothetical protein [Streptococcus suis]CYU86606.1 Uncharacterised protein [Streptococcus suis]
MESDEYKADLFVRYNHFINKRVTFKQKTAFIRSLMTEFQMIDSEIKVVELREKETRTSLSRNIYIGDVKNADVIIATYYDSPLYHFGSYYILDRIKQQNNTLFFNGLVSSILLLSGVLFTLQITNKILPHGLVNPDWRVLFGVGFVYLLLTFLIGTFAKGIGRRRNVVRNNSTIIYLIDKILRTGKLSPKIAYAFLDNGVTNERGLYGLRESVKEGSKILYLDSIGSSEELRFIYEASEDFGVEKSNLFARAGTYRIFPARYGKEGYFLTRKELNSAIISKENSIIVDRIIKQLTK